LDCDLRLNYLFELFNKWGNGSENEIEELPLINYQQDQKNPQDPIQPDPVSILPQRQQ
jgi:hypothetical protein